MIGSKFCPHCGSEIGDDDVEFCTQCGASIAVSNSQTKTDSGGFFDNIIEKTNFSIIIFSFIIFGVFLFVGSLVWGQFLSGGSIDFITYILLTVVVSVFFGGIFTGYFGCKDSSYVIPNFSIYLGSIYAVVLCGIGLIFTFMMGIISQLSSLFSSYSSYSSPYAASQSSNLTPSIDLSGFFKLVVFILAIPVAAYIGVYLGYILKENI